MSRDTRNMRTLRQVVKAYRDLPPNSRESGTRLEAVFTAADAVLNERDTRITPNSRAAVMSEAEGEEA